ncbi:hypothetical protein CC80DRAFT_586257 [Byssothecium circinans]|uniref:Uncharacterized protein n=1 Tax=Byssothecium circinans TaxID=147558 RepID=A0A6A5T6B2_9PLEO|nr:hypothetical protein CC80DRAFT_586257 [Byssothecium circinans]
MPSSNDTVVQRSHSSSTPRTRQDSPSITLAVPNIFGQRRDQPQGHANANTSLAHGFAPPTPISQSAQPQPMTADPSSYQPVSMASPRQQQVYSAHSTAQDHHHQESPAMAVSEKLEAGYKLCKVPMGLLFMLRFKLNEEVEGKEKEQWKLAVDFLDKVFAEGKQVAEERDPILPDAIIYSKTFIITEDDHRIFQKLLTIFPIVNGYKYLLGAGEQSFDQVKNVNGVDRAPLIDWVAKGNSLEELLEKLTARHHLGWREDKIKQNPYAYCNPWKQ